jgi:hypothetical protein
MEKLLKERLTRLESALKAIKGETTPIPGHSDPGAIQDCWASVDDYMAGIKSQIRQVVFLAWQTSQTRANHGPVGSYQDFIKVMGLDELQYLSEDNNNIIWEEWYSKLRKPTKWKA